MSAQFEQIRPYLPMMAARLRTDITVAIRNGEIDLNYGSKSKTERWLISRIENALEGSIELEAEHKTAIYGIPGNHMS